VANLRTRDVEARRHANEAEQMVLEKLERSRKGDEEAAAIKE
jgi:hypothetical protein